MITLVAVGIAVVLFFLGQQTSASLIIIGIVAKYLSPFILTAISLPGRFIAFPNDADKRSKARLILGTIISVFIQSCVYLVYVWFVVGWAASAVSEQGTAIIVWPIAFLATIVPFWFALNEFKRAVKETEHASKDIPEVAKEVIGGPEIKMFNMLAQASQISFVLTIVGFLAFAFAL